MPRGSPRGPDLTFANNLAARLEGHPDNSSASVYGGLTLSWSDSPEEGRAPCASGCTPR